VTPPASKRAQDVFSEALRRDPGERLEFIERTCAGEPELREAAVALLDAHVAAGQPTEHVPLRRAQAHQPEAAAGRKIGPYVIRQELGRGGMGVVYLADDTRLLRQVALKALSPDVGRERTSRERLRREARAAAGLSHPGIATVFALEEIDDDLYLACEYVAGQSLRKVLAEGPLPVATVLDIGVQIARTLAVAHGAGVVHRDLKPENIIRTPAGLVKVLDFGLARIEGQALSGLTHTGTVLGTPAYMAPEQALGQPVDFRTDQFALGVLLYEMASGLNPFVARTVTATLVRIVEVDVPPLSAVCASSSPELDRIIAACLNKDLAQRYATTQALADDLEQLISAAPAPRRRLSGAADVARLEAPTWSRSWTPLGWWRFHQLAVTAVYVLMLYPVWRARAWLAAPWGTLFPLATLVCIAAAVSLRLHLLFMARFYVDELAEQHARTNLWSRLSDGAIAVSLLAAGLGIGSAHPEMAMLFVAVATAAAVGSFVIEPATTRAAFRRSGIGLPAPWAHRSSSLDR
jgi:predicted Ser/Thr protein kinase